MANDIERRKNFFDDMMNVRNWMNPSFFDETPDYMKTDIAETEK